MKNKLKNFLALMIGLFMSIIIVEVFLRIYDPFGFRQKGDEIVLPADFERIYKNETIEGLDSLIKHSKNSLGFRGAEKPNDFENWTSIIAVGGSTTECFYISDGKEWVSLLGDKLNEQFDKIWVNNAGLDGHSTFGHQILLNNFLVKLKPDYIIFLIGCNDIGREDLNNFDKLIQAGNNWKAYLKSNSELLNLIVNLIRISKARKMKLGHSGVKFQELDTVDSINHEKMHQMIEHHKKYTDAFKNRLKELIITTKRNGIIPILVTQPTLVGVGFDESTGIDLEKVKCCDEFGGRVYWEKLELYNDITRELAKNENIFLIDLAQRMPKSTDFYYDCVHYTNKGAEAVSQIIYHDLKEFLTSAGVEESK